MMKLHAGWSIFCFYLHFPLPFRGKRDFTFLITPRKRPVIDFVILIFKQLLQLNQYWGIRPVSIRLANKSAKAAYVVCIWKRYWNLENSTFKFRMEFIFSFCALHPPKPHNFFFVWNHQLCNVVQQFISCFSE